MELLHAQEELNIVIQLMQQQFDLISGFVASLDYFSHDIAQKESSPTTSGNGRASALIIPPELGTYQHPFSSATIDSATQLIDNLQRELADLEALLENANNLVTRTVQLVNLRLEGHGKAILTFTIVTIIFLPLNFVSSFFGMNVADVRDMSSTQDLFWLVACCVTVAVTGASLLFAFYGAALVERFKLWKDERRERVASRTIDGGARVREEGKKGFRVFGVEQGKDYSW